MKGTKLHELTPERLAELVQVTLPVPPPPDIKTPKAIDPHNPTREQAIAAVKAAYKVLTGGAPYNPKVMANRLLSPVILYLESLE